LICQGRLLRAQTRKLWLRIAPIVLLDAVDQPKRSNSLRRPANRSGCLWHLFAGLFNLVKKLGAGLSGCLARQISVQIAGSGHAGMAIKMFADHAIVNTRLTSMA